MTMVQGSNPVTFRLAAQNELPETPQSLVHDLKTQKIMDFALEILSKERVMIGDVGSGDAGLTGFKFDEKLQLVYTETEKVEVKVEGKREDNVVGFTNLTEEKSKLFVNMAKLFLITSWGRDKPSPANQRLVGLLQEMAKRNLGTKVWIVPQEWEARLSHISAMHIIRFNNPNNPYLKGMTPENTFQLEGGQGSIQSFRILLKQTQEMAGRWAGGQLSKGKTLNEVVTSLVINLPQDLADQKAIEAMRFVVLHGIFAIGLSGNDKAKDRTVPRLLGITPEQDLEWRTGQISRSVTQMIAALQTKIENCDKAVKNACEIAIANKDIFNLLYGDESKVDDKTDHEASLRKYIKDNEKSKVELPKEILGFKDALIVQDQAVPPALLLGMLKAGCEKYGEVFANLNAVNHKDPVPLYFPDGTPMNREAKVTPSQGAAVHFLINCKGELSRFGEVFRKCGYCGF